jgi:hypothetical protein
VQEVTEVPQRLRFAVPVPCAAADSERLPEALVRPFRLPEQAMSFAEVVQGHAFTYARFIAAPVLLAWGAYAIIKAFASAAGPRLFAVPHVSGTQGILFTAVLLVGVAMFGNEPDIFRYARRDRGHSIVPAEQLLHRGQHLRGVPAVRHPGHGRWTCSSSNGCPAAAACLVRTARRGRWPWHDQARAVASSRNGSAGTGSVLIAEAMDIAGTGTDAM